MSAIQRVSACVILAGALATPADADEVRLTDGRVLVGPTKAVGKSIHVETLDGVVVIPRTKVSRIRADTELRAELAGLSAQVNRSPRSHIELARTARRWGLHDEMWDHLGHALATCRRGTTSHTGLHTLLGELEPVVLPRKWRNKTTDVRVRELLYRIRPGTNAALQAAIVALLAKEPGADKALRIRARAASRSPQRLAAVAALAQRPAPGNERFVFRTAILDSKPTVRAGAARLAVETDNTAAAVRYLAPGLLHPQPAVRIRTAEAYGHMHALEAVDLLVDAGPLAGKLPAGGDVGGATRGHVAFIDQTSYIRDFDVEVAQASLIADPKVDVLQSGVVLDVTVHAVVLHRTAIARAYRGALRAIAGSDPGSNPKHWNAWRDRQREQRDGRD